MDALQAQRLAQAHLEPEEKLLWAEGANPNRQVLAVCRMLLPLIGVMIGFIGVAAFMFWQSHQSFLDHVSPQSRAFFEQHSTPLFAPALFFGGFFSLFLILILASIRIMAARTLYAVTDRRVLISRALGASGSQVASLSPQEIASIKIHQRANGTGDLLFTPTPSSADKSIHANRAARSARLPEVGFLGVRNPSYVEGLIRELQHRPTPPLTGRLSEEGVRTLLPADLVRRITADEPTFDMSRGRWLIALPFAAIGTACLVMAVRVFLGWTTVYEGDTHTPSDPTSGGIVVGLVGLVFACVGWGLLLWRSNMIFDPSRRVYRYRRGWLPFARWSTGTFEDIAALAMASEKRSTEQSSYIVWCVSLCWRVPGRAKLRLVELKDPVQARAAAYLLSERLHLSLEQQASDEPD